MPRTATRFGLIVTVALLAAANLPAQQAPSAADPRLQPNAGGEGASGQASGRRTSCSVPGSRTTSHRGRTWSRSPNLGAQRLGALFTATSQSLSLAFDSRNARSSEHQAPTRRCSRWCISAAAFFPPTDTLVEHRHLRSAQDSSTPHRPASPILREYRRIYTLRLPGALSFSHTGCNYIDPSDPTRLGTIYRHPRGVMYICTPVSRWRTSFSRAVIQCSRQSTPTRPRPPPNCERRSIELS